MAEAAGLAGALGAALLVLASSRGALLTGLGLVAAALAGLAADGGQLGSASTLLGSPAGLAALVLGLALLALAAAGLVRWPHASLPLLLAVSPIGLPIARDPESPVLLGLAGTGGIGRLYPLFGVLGAATVALAWRTARGAPVPALPRPIALPAAMLAALASASILWTADRAAAVESLLFVWLPFTVLLVVAARAPLGPTTARTLALVLVAIASALAVWAIGQALSGELLFFNASLERANELGSLFRVTAGFQDPNHLGRHLVLAMAVLVVAAWLRGVALPIALGPLALLGTGVLLTYSQSSFVALAVVALGVGIVAGGRRTRRTLGAVSATVSVAAVAAVALVLATGSAGTLTSERSTLVADTAATALAHPLVGVGVAGQPLATRDERRPGTDAFQNTSHTTPLTIAAELGILGLAVFAALLTGAARTLRDLGLRDPALALGVAAVLGVLLVHSLSYGGLFENPITWGALGLAAGAVLGRNGSVGTGLARRGGEAREPPAALRS